MIKFTIPSTFVKQIFIPSFILLIGLAVLCSFFPIQIESNLANIQEYTGRTHQKLSNEPRYRSPFIGDLTRGTF